MVHLRQKRFQAASFIQSTEGSTGLVIRDCTCIQTRQRPRRGRRAGEPRCATSTRWRRSRRRRRWGWAGARLWLRLRPRVTMLQLVLTWRALVGHLSGSLWQVILTESKGKGTGAGKKGRQLISPLPALDDLGSSSDPQLQGSVSGGTGQQWGIPRTTPVKPHREPLSRLGGKAALCAAPVLLAQNIQDPSRSAWTLEPVEVSFSMEAGQCVRASTQTCTGRVCSGCFCCCCCCPASASASAGTPRLRDNWRGATCLSVTLPAWCRACHIAARQPLSPMGASA